MRQTSFRARVIAGAACLVLGAAAPADSPIHVPEPEGLWEGALQGYTPKTLSGAEVVDAAGVEALIARGGIVLVDVSEAEPTPPNLVPGRIWLPVHRAIPGSTWLPGAGSGTLAPAEETALTERVKALTAGDPDTPIVTYCHPDCWGSWNLGKRLVALGYRRVSWFPGGIEGWQDGHDTAAIRPDTAWTRRTGTGARP